MDWSIFFEQRKMRPDFPERPETFKIWNGGWESNLTKVARSMTVPSFVREIKEQQDADLVNQSHNVP
jgi:hypothetical protein